MTKAFIAVALGGSFDRLHRGHKALFEQAFQVGETVIIGVTSDEFAEQLGKRFENPYAFRVERIQDYINEAFPNGRYEIHLLNDYWGARLFEEDVEAIVVSRETSIRASTANKIREAKGFKPMQIIVVETVLADDGLPISTTRIKQGEIDEEGHISH